MFFCVIVIILGLLFDLLGVATAASATPGWEIAPRGSSRAPARLSSKRHRRQKGWKKFPRRQENPTPTTTLAICDQNDGSFYLGPQNYTYQLQCKTEYEGVKIGVQNTDNFEDCIGACIDHNMVNGVGTCLGATFDDKNVLNTCVLWSDVSEILLEEEDEDSADSALLIYGPLGQIFATAVAESGPSSTSEGTHTSTTDLSTALETTSSTYTFANASMTSVDLLVSTHLVVTMIQTSTITETQCFSVAGECGRGTTSLSSNTFGTRSPLPTDPTTQVADASFTTSPSRSPWTSSPAVSENMGTAIGENGSSGGGQPTPTTRSDSSSAESFSITGHTGSAAQTTFTNLVRVTEFRVQPIEICTETFASCSRSSIVDAVIGFRTEISCSPAPCTGVAIVSGLGNDAGVGSRDICVRL